MAALLLVAAVAWNFFTGGASSATATQPGGTRTAPAAADALPGADVVRLSSLEQPREEPTTSTRNPFRFGRRGAAEAPSADSAPLFQPAPTTPAAPAGPAGPPPIPLKFIGVLEKADAKWAVLSVGDGRAPLHGREGDIIDGRYRIVSIGTESIEMMYVDGRGRQTLRLNGQ